MPKPTLRLEYHAPNARKKIRVRNVTATELDRLRYLDLITREQHDAGEAALRDLWKARMLGAGAVNLAGSGGGGDPQPMSTARSKALKAVNEWIRALDAEVGRNSRCLLLTLLCDDRFHETPGNILSVRHSLSATMRIHEARRKMSGPGIAVLALQAFSSTAGS